MSMAGLFFSRPAHFIFNCLNVLFSESCKQTPLASLTLLKRLLVGLLGESLLIHAAHSLISLHNVAHEPTGCRHLIIDSCQRRAVTTYTSLYIRGADLLLNRCRLGRSPKRRPVYYLYQNVYFVSFQKLWTSTSG